MKDERILKSLFPIFPFWVFMRKTSLKYLFIQEQQLLSAVHLIHLVLSMKFCLCFLALSENPFRQPAGYIPPSHAALGEAHLRDLYREDPGGELYCLHLPTVWVSQWGF